MKKFFYAIAVAMLLAVATPVLLFAGSPADGANAYRTLPKPGERVTLDAGHYFTYGFDKRPKMGTCIMRVEIFTRDGKRDTSYTVIGDVDMPSMRGAHSTGGQKFSLSNKGVYLLPVNIAMPGDWEVRFTFTKSGKTVLKGIYLFDM
ncbi:hypothetical protein [Geomesophilobacter sediminis]|uniref:YtkA-like domain-containing protein n=1 Tax=Geomesophilobacter sediminis TaxID=2798584 RepID=A0A8J7M2V0_9BACT|nr:hypothetical protein [Geomesophilobacter sediminis]MBJ6727411.1 hypothetical protein [Geomesophilobacter sediminis]